VLLNWTVGVAQQQFRLQFGAVDGGLNGGVEQINGQVIGMAMEALGEDEQIFQSLSRQFECDLCGFHLLLSRDRGWITSEQRWHIDLLLTQEIVFADGFAPVTFPAQQLGGRCVGKHNAGSDMATGYNSKAGKSDRGKRMDLFCIHAQEEIHSTLIFRRLDSRERFRE
jgi:hypothetical protein